MSIFDTFDSLSSSTEQSKFFKRFSTSAKEQEVLLKPVYFQCSIKYQKYKSGSYQAASIKIMDDKMVIIKDGKQKKKYMDFQEMFRVRCSIDENGRNGRYPYHLIFEKMGKHWTLYVKDRNIFNELFKMIRKYCVLTNFSQIYDTLGFLGKGHFAEVFGAQKKNSKKRFAVKMFKKDGDSFQKNKEFILKEIKIMRFLPDHPHVIQLYEIYEEKDRLYMILEFMKGKDLQNLLKTHNSFTEQQIYWVFHQIVKGIRFLHHQGIMHRDLKPDNILLETESVNSQMKIADFSLAERFTPGQKFMKFCGTPGFMAPEILAGEGYDERVDVYSLGMILYALFVRTAPFKGKDVREIMRKNKRAKISFTSPVWKNYSKEARDLIKRMLKRDPEKRIGLEEIIESDWVKIHLEHKHINTTLPTIISTQLSKTNFCRFSEKSFEKGEHSLHHKNSCKNSVDTSLCLNREGYHKNSALQTYSYLDNLSLNSFLLNSKDKSSITSCQLKSSLKSSNSSFSPQIRSMNKSKHIREDSQKFKKSTENPTLFMINVESLIFETKREGQESQDIINYHSKYDVSCSARNHDLKLSVIVPELKSIKFKRKEF